MNGRAVDDLTLAETQRKLRGDALSFAAEVDSFATDVLASQCSQGNNHRVVKMAQAVRMLRTFQAVLTLVGKELNDGAAALLRGLLEQYFVYRAIEHDQTMLQRATAEVEAESHKALKALSDMDPVARAEDLTDGALSAALSSLRGGTGFNAFDWAAKSGMQDAHRTLYRLLSPYVHGSIGVLVHYVRLNEAGQAEGICSKIAYLESIEFILCAASMLLECTERLNDEPNTESRRAMFGLLASDQRALYGRYWALKEAKECATH